MQVRTCSLAGRGETRHGLRGTKQIDQRETWGSRRGQPKMVSRGDSSQARLHTRIGWPRRHRGTERVRRARRSVTVLRESSYPCGGSRDRDCSVTASQPAKKTKILRFVLQRKPEILCVSVSPWRVLRVSQVESVAS